MPGEQRMRESYTPPAPSPAPAPPPMTEDVIRLLTTILTQVKDQPALQPRPLSDQALAANASYRELRIFLAHR